MNKKNTQERLLKILEKNKDTVYGKKYRFDSIKTLESYQENVPITKYSTYAPYIEKATQNGHAGYIIGENPYAYALTSGTIGVAKIFPITEDHVEPYVEAFKKTIKEGGKTFLLFDSLIGYQKFKDQAQLDTILGTLIYLDKQKRQRSFFKMFLKEKKIFNPSVLIFPTEITDSNYIRLLFALLEPEINQFAAPFSLGVWEMFLCLEEKWPKLCNDIENGTLKGDYNISDEYKKRLESILSPNKKRADELRSIFAQGFNEPVAKKIWPNLNRIVAASTGSFAIYRQNLKKYIGDIEIINGFYASSEAFIGTSVPGTDLYELCNNGAVFEFVNHNNSESKPIFSYELEEGVTYDIVITSYAGLYRYYLGDVIRVEMVDNDKIFIRYLGRSNGCITKDGDELFEYNVYAIVKEISKALGVMITDYCIHLNNDGAFDKILLEVSKYEFKNFEIPYDKIKDIERKVGFEIGFLEPDTQLLYREIQKYKKQISPDKLKPVRYIRNKETEKFFKDIK